MVRDTKWHKNLKLAQATWLYMFHPTTMGTAIQNQYDIPVRTLRRYAAIARSRDPTLEQTGVIWNWDPATFRLPAWPKASDAIYATKMPDQQGIPISLYAAEYAGKIAPVGSRNVKGFVLKMAQFTPAPKKRKCANPTPKQPKMVYSTPPTKSKKSRVGQSVTKSPSKKQPARLVPSKVRFTMGKGQNMYLDVWHDDYEIPRTGWTPPIRRVKPAEPVKIDPTDWSVPPPPTYLSDANLPILVTVDGVQTILCGGSVEDLLGSLADTNVTLFRDVLGF